MTDAETSTNALIFILHQFLSSFPIPCSDWTQCIDNNSGHPYFWNISTKEVTWEMPAEYEAFLRRSALSKRKSQDKWIICYSDDGTKYFFNEATREISWEESAEYTESYTPQANGKKTSAGPKSSESSKEKPQASRINFLFDKKNNSLRSVRINTLQI